MKITVKKNEDVYEGVIPFDQIITLEIDGVIRTAQVWSDAQGNGDTEWQGEDQEWYNNLSDEESDQVYEAVQGAVNIGGNEAPRTLCVEVSGGVVQDVYGLPEGWSYELADYDDEEGDEERESECDAMIERAKKIDPRYN